MTDNAPEPMRVIFCPACGARFVVDEQILAAENLVVLCTTCGKGSPFGAADRARAAETQAIGVTAMDESLRPRVIVGHEVPAASRMISDTLRRGGYAPVNVHSGDQVLAACDAAMPARPAAVVLDVGIPGVLAFEIVEALRAHPSTADLPVVLLASVYERTRYKRRPKTLYGANTYLELHHVPDRLVEILDTLVRREPVGDERLQSPVDRARAVALRDAPDAHAQDGSRALARRLLADVALYHGDEIAQGVRSGAPFARVQDAVAAARDIHSVAGGLGGVFEEELNAFSARLLEREGRGKPVA